MGHEFPFETFLQNIEDKQEIQENKTKQAIENIKSTINDEQPVNQHNPLNTAIAEFIQKSIDSTSYELFFKNGLHFRTLDNGVAIFTAATHFIKDSIERDFIPLVQAALKGTLGNHFEISIELDPKEKSENTNVHKVSTKHKSVKDVTFNLDLNETKNDLTSKIESQYIDHTENHNQTLIDPYKTFDNFIVGPSNNMAFAAAYNIGNNPGSKGKYPCLYLYSNSGLGKTHLLNAIANEIRGNYADQKICIISCRELIKEMIEAFKTRTIEDFQNKYYNSFDVLMIDDIHELKNKEGTQNEFFHIFNELYNKGKQLVFTSDKAPNEIDGLEERIRTRLQWGLVVDIQIPDLETRIAILKYKAQELDLYIADDILNYVALCGKNSIRELEGMLVKIQAFSDLMSIEPDLEMVKDSLGITNDLNSDENGEITIERITKSTASYLKISIADLKSKSRNKEVAYARHIIMYLSRKMNEKYTLIDIGRFFGGRDHTTVRHAIEKISEQIKTNSTMSKDIIQIESLL